jgi:hypothetical protein
MMERSLNNVAATALQLSPLIPPHTELNKHEYSVHSQFGEDGVLAWIFSKIEPKTKTLVEVGCGSGRQCNTAHMVLNLGWRGLLIDGSAQNVREAREFFKYLLPWQLYAQTQIEQHFVTVENINEILLRHRTLASPDLLTIDIDGNDYWIWEAITAIDPQVVVVEYNSTYGKKEALVTPYQERFDAYAQHPLGLYHGASLQALCVLAQKKGYAFIGCESNGANAFFVKQTQAHLFSRVLPQEAFYENQHKAKRGSIDEQRRHIEHLRLVRLDTK